GGIPPGGGPPRNGPTWQAVQWKVVGIPVRTLPAGVRRLVLAVVAVTVVLAPSAATLWVSTPSGADIQTRVAAITRSYGVVLLNPDEIPSTLAEAVVATEDERFYTHHGIDSIGLARALLYDASNRFLCQGGST